MTGGLDVVLRETIEANPPAKPLGGVARQPMCWGNNPGPVTAVSVSLFHLVLA